MTRSSYVVTWTAEFLECLRSGLTVTEACREIGQYRSNVYRYRADHPGFRLAWDAAKKGANDGSESVCARVGQNPES